MKKTIDNRIKDSLTWDPEILKKVDELRTEKRLSRSLVIEFIVEYFFNDKKGE